MSSLGALRVLTGNPPDENNNESACTSVGESVAVAVGASLPTAPATGTSTDQGRGGLGASTASLHGPYTPNAQPKCIRKCRI